MGYQPDYDNPALKALSQDMNTSLGCYLIGCVLNLCLMGVLGMQVLDYYKFFPGDKRSSKVVVALLLITGLFQSGCFVEMIWHPLIDGFGDLNVWNNSRWTWWSEPVVTTIISLICQVFYLDRCWRVTRSYIVLVVAILGMLVETAFGTACTYFLSQFKLYTLSNKIQSKVSASGWLACLTATDIWISLFLVVHLARERRRHQGFESTDRILQSITAYTLKTSALTSAWSLVNLITYAGASSSVPFLISVMFTLNSRIDIRKILSVHNVQMSSSQGYGDNQFTQSAIHIRTEVEREYELERKISTDKVHLVPSPLVDKDAASSIQFSDQSDVDNTQTQHKGPQDSVVENDAFTRTLRFDPKFDTKFAPL